MMSVSEILDTGFRITRNHFRALAGLAALIFIPATLMTEASNALIQPSTSGAGSILPLAIAVIVAGLYLIVAWPLIMLSVTHAVGEVYQGRPIDVRKSLREAWRLMPAFLGTSLIVVVAVTVGLLLLVLPGIYLIVSYTLISAVLLFERRSGLEAMRRSQSLMKGHIWRGLGLLLVAGLAGGIFTGAVQLTVGFLPYIGPLINGVVGSAHMVFGSAINVVLYFDLRCRKEYFDLTHLAAVVSEADPVAATAPSVVVPAFERVDR